MEFVLGNARQLESDLEVGVQSIQEPVECLGISDGHSVDVWFTLGAPGIELYNIDLDSVSQPGLLYRVDMLRLCRRAGVQDKDAKGENQNHHRCFAFHRVSSCISLDAHILSVLQGVLCRIRQSERVFPGQVTRLSPVFSTTKRPSI
jgi:hypothetical protein